MKTSQFVIFIIVVIVVYGLINSLIFTRGLQAIPAGSAWRPYYIVSFWLIAGTFILARFMERACPGQITGIITWIGSFWLAFLLYFSLIALVLDITRLLHHFFNFLPDLFYVNYERTKVITLLVSMVLVTVVVACGFINARIPRIKKLDLHIAKVVQGEKSLKIVMASDIHLGTIIARRKANRLVSTINSLNPDIVLFAGDIVDEDLAPVINNNLGANLLQLKSRFGVYGITGNHEYIGGAEPAVKYLTEHGVTMLRDTAIFIDGRFWLAGRDDRDKSRFSGKVRKVLEKVLEPMDRAFPVILMDHQPFSLDKLSGAGVDLQLSGHTHHGQMWPFNYITSAIFEVSSGYKKIGNTHVYVSNGFGTWGPPVRLGNRPEIVEINLTFD